MGGRRKKRGRRTIVPEDAVHSIEPEGELGRADGLVRDCDAREGDGVEPLLSYRVQVPCEPIHSLVAGCSALPMNRPEPYSTN